MKIDEAEDIVISAIVGVLDQKSHVSRDTVLVGEKALLDSMKLVEVCLLLEDLAQEENFEFDWTSENAMSKSKSIFRSVSALAEEFSKQSEA